MATRRKFINQLAHVTLATGLSSFLPSNAAETIDSTIEAPFEERADLQLYTELLMQWTDAMLKLQITDKTFSGLYGGNMCPACGRIHGRCGDAVYPFMWMAEKTGKQEYLDAAKRVVQWANNNVTMHDGSWVNDVNINLYGKA